MNLSIVKKCIKTEYIIVIVIILYLCFFLATYLLSYKEKYPKGTVENTIEIELLQNKKDLAKDIKEICKVDSTEYFAMVDTLHLYSKNIKELINLINYDSALEILVPSAKYSISNWEYELCNNVNSYRSYYVISFCNNPQLFAAIDELQNITFTNSLDFPDKEKQIFKEIQSKYNTIYNCLIELSKCDRSILTKRKEDKLRQEEQAKQKRIQAEKAKAKEELKRKKSNRDYIAGYHKGIADGYNDASCCLGYCASYNPKLNVVNPNYSYSLQLFQEGYNLGYEEGYAKGGGDY